MLLEEWKKGDILIFNYEWFRVKFMLSFTDDLGWREREREDGCDATPWAQIRTSESVGRFCFVSKRRAPFRSGSASLITYEHMQGCVGDEHQS